MPIALWALSMGPAQGEQSGKQCSGARLGQDLQYRATAVAWGCCPDWDAFPEDQSQSSEAVLSEEYNWGSKSPWSQLQILELYGKAELQVLNSGSLLELWLSPEHRDLPLGKAFFSYY